MCYRCLMQTEETHHEIRIRQLDAEGKCYRSFTQYAKPSDLEERLNRIRMAFNLERTQVLIDGSDLWQRTGLFPLTRPTE